MTDASAPRYKTPQDRDLVPRMMVRAMLVLVLSVLAIVSYARFTDAPLVSTPPQSPVVLERQFFLSGDMGGRATVLDANGSVIAKLSPEEGGFIAGVERVINRERIKHDVARTGPVIVRQHENGRLSIHDPSTGWRADLMGFGADNAAAFAKLLAN